ncbi:CDP-alcohol phosphatidyltransferase family protein [Candidatus Kaiserbacteria bacterium]|nr:CDP-alcohol phosphatidyltransferase family protein [Candidatus Kaiserbacteria bacterium]
MPTDLAKTGFQFLGARPGSFESVILRLIKAPPWEESVANNITMARLRLGFWGTLGFYWPYSPKHDFLPLFHWAVWIALASLIIAALLDAADGPVARKFDGRETAFGRFIDPLADKAIAWSAFSVLLHLYGAELWLAIPIAGIVAYDVDTSYQRARDNKKMQPNQFAKAKQWPLNIGVGALLFAAFLDPSVTPWFNVGSLSLLRFIASCGGLFLWIAFVLAAISAGIYHKQQLRFWAR